MDNRYHSVRLLKERCRGCSACLMRCPTQAIRVRDGRAHIIKELCIDCGQCILACQSHAKVAETNSMEDIGRFPFKVALPAPSFYAQFGRQALSPAEISKALLAAGFDAVYEVARGAEAVSEAMRRMMAQDRLPRPMISSACPAVTRLIQVRFPSLIPCLTPFRQPMEVAASAARRMFSQSQRLKPQEIGIFFITPCPAKMTAIFSPIGQERSAVDGAISITELYGLTLPHLEKAEKRAEGGQASAEGLNWAAAGGEMAALRIDSAMVVDGIDNVIRVLEEIENGKLNDLQFLEGAACVGGCLGGPLVFDNNYVARNSLRLMARRLPETAADAGAEGVRLKAELPILPNPVMQLDDNMGKALEKMEKMREIVERLPGLDCGSCGSPSCESFAEDIVRGYCVEMDCIHLLKERLRVMAQQMVDLSAARRE